MISTALGHTATWGLTGKTVLVLSQPVPEIFDIDLDIIKTNTKTPLSIIISKIMQLAYLVVWYDTIL